MKNAYTIFLGVLVVCLLHSIQTIGQNETPITELLKKNRFQPLETNFNVTTSNDSDGILWTNEDRSTDVVLFDDGKQGFTIGGDINNDQIRDFLNTVNNAVNSIPETIALWKIAVNTLVDSTYEKTGNTNRLVSGTIITEDEVRIIDRQTRSGQPARLSFGEAQSFVAGTSGVFRLSLPGETRGILRTDIRVDFNIPPDVARAALLNWSPKKSIEIPKIQTLDRDALDLTPIEDLIKDTFKDALLKQLKIEGLSSALETAEEILEEEVEEINPLEFIRRLTLAYGNAGQSVKISRKLVNFCALNTAIANNVFNQVGFQLGRIGILGPDEDRALPSITGRFTTNSPRFDKTELKTKKRNKSFKSCGNSKGNPRTIVSDNTDDFSFCGVRVKQRKKDEWEFIGIVFKDDDLFSDELDDRADLARARHSSFRQIDNDILRTEINSFNSRLFNGESLPVGLQVTDDITTKFKGLSTDYIKNYAIVNNLDLEQLSKDINNRDIPGGNRPLNDTDNDDDIEVIQIIIIIITGGGGGDGSRQNSRLGADEIPSLLITENNLAQPDLFKTIMENNGLKEHKVLEKIFQQALTVSNDKQGLYIGEGTTESTQAELFQFTYAAAAGAKQYLEAYMNSQIETKNTTDVWINLLKSRDNEIYTRILEKLQAFYQTDRAVTDGSVFIAPQLSFELEITPTVPISKDNGIASLQLKDMSYDIDIALTSARLALATDTDQDLKADLGVVLNEEELQFLQESWAVDTDDDGFIDDGYLMWLQQKLHKTKRKLSKAITDGKHEVFGNFNQVMIPLAAAEFYKQQLAADASLSQTSPELAALVDQDNLKTNSLLAKRNIPFDFHTSVQSDYLFEASNQNETSISFIPSSTGVRWNPVTFEASVLTAGQGSKGSSTSRTAAALAPELSFTNSDTELKPETLILGVTSLGTLTLNNTTNAVIPAATYILTTSTSEDIMYFDVAKFDAPEIPVGGSLDFFFEYTPIAADSKSGNREEFRLHRVGEFNTILYQRDFLIEESSIDAIELGSFCEESTILFNTIAAGEDILTGAGKVNLNNIAEAGSKLTVKAINHVDLTDGFDARPGSTVEFSISDCPTVQNAIISGLE